MIWTSQEPPSPPWRCSPEWEECTITHSCCNQNQRCYERYGVGYASFAQCRDDCYQTRATTDWTCVIINQPPMLPPSIPPRPPLPPPPPPSPPPPSPPSPPPPPPPSCPPLEPPSSPPMPRRPSPPEIPPTPHPPPSAPPCPWKPAPPSPPPPSPPSCPPTKPAIRLMNRLSPPPPKSPPPEPKWASLIKIKEAQPPRGDSANDSAAMLYSPVCMVLALGVWFCWHQHARNRKLLLQEAADLNDPTEVFDRSRQRPGRKARTVSSSQYYGKISRAGP